VADEAFTAFVQAHGAALLRFAYLLCRDSARAEDLVQDALVKMLRRWRSAGVADQPVAYARRVVSTSTSVGGGCGRPAKCSAPVETAAPYDFDAVGDRDRVVAINVGRCRPALAQCWCCATTSSCPIARLRCLLGCAEATVRSIAARAFSALRVHVLETEEA